MPGLAGFAFRRPMAAATKAVSGMLDLLTHGPSYRVDVAAPEGDRVGGGAAHLGIFGSRAMLSGPDLTLWFDGEILSYRGQPVVDPLTLLRDEYRREGGFGFLSDADGTFAAVVHDGAKVHLVTDRYGLRPLYWSALQGGVAWASEAKAFLAVPGFAPQVDPRAVDEFLQIGHLLEDRSWFRGVGLVPSGSVLTCDLDSSRIEVHRYWWWDRIAPVPGGGDRRELTAELGRVLRRAVEVRCEGDVGLQLSGGLDSRAILAGIPEGRRPATHAVTFGMAGSADLLLAARAAGAAGVRHHPVVLSADNWLQDRLAGVWWTDGEFDLLHMHAVALNNYIRSLYAINLNGFAGDLIAGGGYLRRDLLDQPVSAAAVQLKLGCGPELVPDLAPYRHLGKSDYFFLQNRVRRFTLGGTRYSSVAFEHRTPFFDNALIEFIYSLPDRMRMGSGIYNAMLLREFPALFRDIPWEKTGFSIRNPPALVWMRRFPGRATRRVARALGRREIGHQSYTDYPGWMRQEPARSFFDDLFLSPAARAGEFVAAAAIEAAWRAHLAGENHSAWLGRVATMEIWLRQVFAGELRPGPVNPP